MPSIGSRLRHDYCKPAPARQAMRRRPVGKVNLMRRLWCDECWRDDGGQIEKKIANTPNLFTFPGYSSSTAVPQEGCI